jgi:hypothetical protein
LACAQTQMTPDRVELLRVVDRQTHVITSPETIEIRARVRGDKRKWGDIPAETRWTFTPDRTAGHFGDTQEFETGKPVVEVRWNYPGSLQGHYIHISGRYGDFPSVKVKRVK